MMIFNLGLLGNVQLINFSDQESETDMISLEEMSKIIKHKFLIEIFVELTVV